MARVERVERDAVRHRPAAASAPARAARALRGGDAVEEGVRALGLEHFRRIPLGRQMQGHQHRRAGRRQIGVEIDAVHVDEVDRPAARAPARSRARCAACARAAHGIGDGAGRARGGDQRPGRARARAGDHDRAMTGAHQRGIELREHLLGAAHGVRADRGEREGDAEDAQAHGRSVIRSAGAAAQPPAAFRAGHPSIRRPAPSGHAAAPRRPSP